jgi:hypothetical protein
MTVETDYKCLVKGCNGILIENHPTATTHWLECDCCGETYSFIEYFDLLEEQ